MKYRKLGASDLEVSEISLGSWLTYGVGVELDPARACVNKAFDLGINFIDTANVYGRGAAESVLGELLAGRPRDSYVLATKVFGQMSDTDQGLSAVQIAKQIDASLQRLRVDHVDLYQCHRYDTATPLEETMAALTKVVKEGKARYIGFSEWAPAQIEASFEVAGSERFVSSQPQYSLLWRRPEQKVIPLCAANGVSQIVWSPIAQGVLSGKYAPGAPIPEGSRAASDSMGAAIRSWMQPPVLEAVANLKPLAAKAGCSLTQFALAWVLREPNVASAIVGASRHEQLVENAGASGLQIDPALFREAETIVAGVERAAR
ncbi:MAG TPA: aldo/keto reductase family protein [Caulobacteraceae bacterium]|jgi:aryl-alcohol dehydrogenase-like predicted oxidoreductase